MLRNHLKPLVAFCIFSTLIIAYACKKNDNGKPSQEPKLKDYSVTPALLKKLSGFQGMDVYTLISSEDSLPGYRFGGSADGAGIISAQNGNGFILMVNNEDNYSVSRLLLDKDLKPTSGTYALNSDGGQWRLCSGTMATPSEHGFGPLYLSAGESSVEGMTHGLDPFQVINPNTPRGLAGLGRWSAENSVPLHKNAYPGKTVVLIGEDASDATGGQMVMYMSDALGDLVNGSQYMLKRIDGNQREMDMTAGATYDVEFVKIENHKALTGVQIQAMVDPLKAIKFGRVEDLDYRKGNAVSNREVYFNVTGQDTTGFNADHSRTRMGRTYRLLLDDGNPLKGKLTCILDGDDENGPARMFQNPDNICATTNFVYIQEDSNTYGTEDHDAYIYQYNIATGELRQVIEMDHRRTAADAAKYNVEGPSAPGSWEYGALIDISETTGITDLFALCIQPHTWIDQRFAGVDGGEKRKTEMQGSQVVLLKGLPR
jgi:hypothetical protein